MTSSDPNKGLMYVASIDVPFMIKLEGEIPRTFRTVGIGGPDRGASGGGPGRVVYARNCQACHGADRAGVGGVPSLIGVVSRLSADGVRGVVRNGVGKMPAFGTMNAADLDALIAYLSPSPGGQGSVAVSERPATPLGGPVVASGGAPAAIEFLKTLPSPPPEYGMSGGPPYPSGTDAPAQRYYTGFDANREIISPPWSSLTAYDLNKGTIKWKIPYGEEPRAVAEGIRNTGLMQDQRSVLVTPTGLLFSGTSDGYIRALDADNGKVLWSAQLPAAAYGIPAMYEVNGRAYIVVSAAASRNGFGIPPSLKLIDGGSGQPRAYVVFALPAKL